MSQQDGFDPKILGFLCNWCSYAGADLAGVSRFQYPTNLRVIRVMCSGRVDPTLVLEAFIRGIDGVMVLGCHPGECHYILGNYYAEGRMKTLQRFLEIIGVKPERLLLDWVSASEGERFANLVSDFTKKIVKIGTLSTDISKDEFQKRLLAAKEAFSQHRTRWLINRERELLVEGNVFGERVDQDDFNKIKFESVVKDYEKNRILFAIRDKALSVTEIAQTSTLTPQEVLRHLIIMEQNGLVTVSEIDGVKPMYKKMRG
ncbi:methyl-viologen-reducing hydrogenase subunit delta [Candidatus Bathyarchaeota archaeon]|nr:MAG: methyl-viologen-reducing hydrogenase subunit delta [Candidatus Bathyarchaeota archaeon]